MNVFEDDKLSPGGRVPVPGIPGSGMGEGMRMRVGEISGLGAGAINSEEERPTDIGPLSIIGDRWEQQRRSQRLERESVQGMPQYEPVGVSIETVSYEYMRKIAPIVILPLPNPPIYPELFSNQEGKDAINIVNNAAMGPTDGGTCITCMRIYPDCLGHLGLIPFRSPISNPMYMAKTVLVLKSVCNDCSTPFLSEELLRKQGLLKVRGDRLKLIATASPNSCSRKPEGRTSACKTNREYHVNEYQIEAKQSTAGNHVLDVCAIYRILDRISDDSAKLLGFNIIGNSLSWKGSHPRNLVLQGIVVSPPRRRPATVTSDGKMFPHSMTEFYSSILSKEIEIRKKPMNAIIDTTALSTAVASMMGIDTRARSQRQITIRKYITGKDAAPRDQVYARRATVSMRNVVTNAGPTLRYGEIGLPRRISQNLTIPIIVTMSNVSYIRRLIREGKVKYIMRGKDGLRSSNFSYYLSVPLEPGWEVGRVIQDGDYAIVGRNPSLHHYSLEGRKIKIVESESIKLDISSTSPYGADFDGDELHVVVPQSREARYEVSKKMNAENCIISTSGAPLVGLILDHTVAAYILTEDLNIVSRPLYFSCLNTILESGGMNDIFSEHNTLDQRAQELGVRPYSGKKLFSALLPAGLFMRTSKISVTNGILVSGRITAEQVGVSRGSIAHAISNQFGNDRAADFLSAGMMMLTEYLNAEGLTVRLNDCQPDSLDEFNKDVRAMIKKTQEDLDQRLTPEVNSTSARTKIVTSVIKQFETKVTGMVTEVMSSRPDNNLMKMASSGSKGSIQHIAKMFGPMGAMYHHKELIKPTLPGQRVLPTDRYAQVTLQEIGICTSSLCEGLPPDQYYLTCVDARGSLLESGPGVSAPGNLSRHLIEAMLNVIVGTDSTVVDNHRYVIQPVYGTDGLLGSKTISIKNKFNESVQFPLDIEATVDAINYSCGWIRE